MRPLSLLALLILASAPAAAQQRPVGGSPRITIPSNSNHFSWEGKHGGFHGLGALRQAQDERVFIVVERETVREVVREAPPPQAAANSGTPNSLQCSSVSQTDCALRSPISRKPYVVGSTYASLPGGCMKLVELAGSYYFCGGGEWYRQVGDGPSARYKAVARKL